MQVELCLAATNKSNDGRVLNENAFYTVFLGSLSSLPVAQKWFKNNNKLTAFTLHIKTRFRLIKEGVILPNVI